VREDVMKVVVALAVGEEGQHRVVARAVLICVRPRAPHVASELNEEGEVMADDDAQQAGQDERAPEIPGEEPCRAGEAEIDDERDRQVVAVLKGEQRIAL